MEKITNTGTPSSGNIQRSFTGNCEEFRDIPGWEGYYQVSNLGTVRSIPRTVVSRTGKVYNRKGKVMSQHYSKDGYKVVDVTKEGRNRTLGVHRAMALAFISNPNNKPMVNHINAKRDDNRLDNLEWCTNAENIQHSFNLGISDNRGDKHPRRVLTMEIVRGIRAELESGKSPVEVANIFDIKRRNVYAVRDRQNWNYE
jgi:hypothetical protein